MALPPGALGGWATRQKALLSDAYDKAWRRGVQRYKPKPDPEEEEDEEGGAEEEGEAGDMRALARGHHRYRAPTEPNPDRKRLTLERPHQGIDRMVREVEAIQTTPSLAPGGPHTDAAAATAAWAASNMYRLAVSAGSVVWGGEQAGFAAAAGRQQQLLTWVCAEDERSCEGCLEMADMPPMIEEEWPFFPGAGGTECGGNCRCGMDVAPLADATEVEPEPELEPAAAEGE